MRTSRGSSRGIVEALGDHLPEVGLRVPLQRQRRVARRLPEFVELLADPLLALELDPGEPAYDAQRQPVGQVAREIELTPALVLTISFSSSTVSALITGSMCAPRGF